MRFADVDDATLDRLLYERCDFASDARLCAYQLKDHVLAELGGRAIEGYPFRLMMEARGFPLDEKAMAYCGLRFADPDFGTRYRAAKIVANNHRLHRVHPVLFAHAKRMALRVKPGPPDMAKAAEELRRLCPDDESVATFAMELEMFGHRELVESSLVCRCPGCAASTLTPILAVLDDLRPGLRIETIRESIERAWRAAMREWGSTIAWCVGSCCIGTSPTTNVERRIMLQDRVELLDPDEVTLALRNAASYGRMWTEERGTGHNAYGGKKL